jgi:hypothetical protein
MDCIFDVLRKAQVSKTRAEEVWKLMDDPPISQKVTMLEKNYNSLGISTKRFSTSE